MGIGLVKKAQNLQFFTDIQLFFLNRCSLECCKPLLILRVWKKLILTIFASVFISLMEEEIFRGPSYKIVLRVLFKDRMGRR